MKRKASFSTWRKRTNALDWFKEYNFPWRISHLIVSSCYMAYECGRRHQKQEMLDEKRIEDYS